MPSVELYSFVFAMFLSSNRGILVVCLRKTSEMIRHILLLYRNNETLFHGVLGCCPFIWRFSRSFPDIADVFQICITLPGLKDLAEGFGPIRNRHG